MSRVSVLYEEKGKIFHARYKKHTSSKYLVVDSVHGHLKDRGAYQNHKVTGFALNYVFPRLMSLPTLSDIIVIYIKLNCCLMGITESKTCL